MNMWKITMVHQKWDNTSQTRFKLFQTVKNFKKYTVISNVFVVSVQLIHLYNFQATNNLKGIVHQ